MTHYSKEDILRNYQQVRQSGFIDSLADLVHNDNNENSQQ